SETPRRAISRTWDRSEKSWRHLILVIVRHQLRGPLRLPRRADRCELCHPRLDVENRRAIDRVESTHRQHAALDISNRTARQPNPVWPRLAALRENPD